MKTTSVGKGILVFLIAFLTAGQIGRKDQNANSSFFPFRVTINECSALCYKCDECGNTLGAKDFYICDDTIFILSSSSNSVLRYDELKYQSQILLDDYNLVGIQIAASSHYLFVYDNHSSITVFKGTEVVSSTPVMNILKSEAIDDFYYDSEKLVITVEDPVIMGPITYIFSVQNGGKIQFFEKKIGLYYDDKEIIDFTHTLNSDGSTTLTLHSKNSTVSFDIYHDLLGCRYLGKANNSLFCFHTYEIQADDGLEFLAERLYYINSQGTIERELLIPRQIISVVNQIKIINGEAYMLNTQSGYVEIINLDSQSEYYDQNLEYLVPISWSGANDYTFRNEPSSAVRTNSASPKSLMTRQSCIDRAYTYYNYSWTITNSNLASAPSDWAKPHFINGPGTYWRMPYCWGGFHSTSQFTSAMANGGLPGQATSSYLSGTYGLDCSGFVSRAWARLSKLSTSGLASTGTSTSISWSDVGMADALIRLSAPAHARLLMYVNASGNYVCYECTTSNQWDKVVTTTYTAQAMTNNSYSPYRFNYLSDP